MRTYKIKFDKQSCVGSGLCTSVAPDNWKLVESGEGQKAKPSKLIINEEEYETNSQAEALCPVQAILIEKMKKSAFKDEEHSFEDMDLDEFY
jgi:ferredoxin